MRKHKISHLYLGTGLTFSALCSTGKRSLFRVSSAIKNNNKKKRLQIRLFLTLTNWLTSHDRRKQSISHPYHVCRPGEFVFLGGVVVIDLLLIHQRSRTLITLSSAFPLNWNKHHLVKERVRERIMCVMKDRASCLLYDIQQQVEGWRYHDKAFCQLFTTRFTDLLYHQLNKHVSHTDTLSDFKMLYKALRSTADSLIWLLWKNSLRLNSHPPVNNYSPWINQIMYSCRLTNKRLKGVICKNWPLPYKISGRRSAEKALTAANCAFC